MKRVSTFLILLLCPLFFTRADTFVAGPLISDTTWGPDAGTYILIGEVFIPKGVTLTIEPGTIIKSRPGGSAVITVEGTLSALGTSSERIYFTSLYDDEIGGDTDLSGPTTGGIREWQGIYFRQGSIGNLDNIILKHAGYGGGIGFGNFTALENNGGKVFINNSDFERNSSLVIVNNSGGTLSLENSKIDGGTRGFSMDSGVAVINQNIFKNNQQAIDIRDGVLNLNRNNFIDNGKTGSVQVDVEFYHEDNVSSDKSLRGYSTSGVISRDTLWHTRDLPIIIEGGFVEVAPGSTLTIEKGSVIKMGDIFGTGSISILGNLIAEGTETEKIFFTSIKDDAVAGDTNADADITTPTPKNWGAIYLENGATASFKNVVVRYGGYSANGEYIPGVSAGLYNRGASLSIRNSSIVSNSSSGLFQDAGTSNIHRVEFANTHIGIQFRGGNISVSNSSFYGHLDHGIRTEMVDLVFTNPPVKASYNWWGDISGPSLTATSTPSGSGEKLGANVSFEPWLESDPTSVPERTPVIIVPGMMGSRLVDESDREVWPNISRIILSPGDNFLDILSLNANTKSDHKIESISIIENVFSRDFFSGLFSELSKINFVKGLNILTAPYDWRLDIPDMSWGSSYPSRSLNEVIEQIKIQANVSEVDIVAHSMGGLLVKEYIRKNGGGSIRKFIDIGTPHFGSPNAFKVLTLGDDLGFRWFNFTFLDSGKIKSISQNMPSVYQLLPSRKYFDGALSEYKYYIFDGVNKASRLDFDQTKNYLKNSGRNQLLVERADDFHQGIDDLNPEDYGIETHNIVSCGVPTIGQIFVLEKKDDDHYIYNIRMIDGDGTVPLRSAMGLPVSNTYYFKDVEHAVMPSAEGISGLIVDILSSDEGVGVFGNYANLVSGINDCGIPDGQLVSFHSPVDLHIYSPDGKHAGPDINGHIENNIDGVIYEILEDNKFAFLPAGQDYRVEGVVTGDGVFDFRAQKIIGAEVSETTVFNDVSVVLGGKINVDLNKMELEVSTDENKSSGMLYKPTSISSGILEFSRIKDKEVEVDIEGGRNGNAKPVTIGQINLPIPLETSQLLILSGDSQGNQFSEETELLAAPLQKFSKERKEELETNSKRGIGNSASAYNSGFKFVKVFLLKIWGWIKYLISF